MISILRIFHITKYKHYTIDCIQKWNIKLRKFYTNGFLSKSKLISLQNCTINFDLYSTSYLHKREFDIPSDAVISQQNSK